MTATDVLLIGVLTLLWVELVLAVLITLERRSDLTSPRWRHYALQLAALAAGESAFIIAGIVVYRFFEWQLLGQDLIMLILRASAVLGFVSLTLVFLGKGAGKQFLIVGCVAIGFFWFALAWVGLFKQGPPIHLEKGPYYIIHRK